MCLYVSKSMAFAAQGRKFCRTCSPKMYKVHTGVASNCAIGSYGHRPSRLFLDFCVAIRFSQSMRRSFHPSSSFSQFIGSMLFVLLTFWGMGIHVAHAAPDNKPPFVAAGDLKPYAPALQNLLDFEAFYQAYLKKHSTSELNDGLCYTAMRAQQRVDGELAHWMHGEGKQEVLQVTTPPTMTNGTLQPGNVQTVVQNIERYRIFENPLPALPGFYAEDHMRNDKTAGCIPTMGDSSPLGGRSMVQLYQNEAGTEYRFRWVSISPNDGTLTAGKFLNVQQTQFFLESQSSFGKAFFAQFFHIHPDGGQVKSETTPPPQIPTPVPPKPKETKPPVPVSPESKKPENLTTMVTVLPGQDIWTSVPAYPGQIQGPDMQAVGGSGRYTMQLDSTLGGKQPKKEIPRNSVEYSWTVYDITELAKRGLTPGITTTWAKAPPLVKAKEIGKTAGNRRDLARELEDLKEDGKTSYANAEHAAAKFQKDVATQLQKGGKIGNIIEDEADLYINAGNLALTLASGIKSLGGFVVMSLIEVLGGDSQDRSIPWTHEGIFLIRCIATPRYQFSLNPASTVAVKIVEVRSTEYLARNTLEAADAEIERIHFEWIQAQDQPTRQQLERQLVDATVQAQGKATETLRFGIKEIEKRLEDVEKGQCKFRLIDLLVSWWNSSQPDEKREQCKVLQERLRIEKERLERLRDFADTKERLLKDQGATQTYRPQAAFASQANGASFPLLLQLGKIKSTDGQIHWKLFDATSEGTQDYEGVGSSDEDAIWDAFQSYSHHNGYDRGYLAIRLPKDKIFASMQRQSALLRNVAQGGALLRQRLNDLTIVLTALSLFVPGVGQVAFLLNGALAIDRLYQKLDQGTLGFGADTVNDVVAVLGVAGAGLGTLGKFRLAKAKGAFALLKGKENIAAVQAALQRAEKATTFIKNTALVNEVINSGGLILGNVQMLAELNSISHEEAEGNLTHAEASRMRYQHLLSGMQNNVLYIQGLKHGQEAKGSVAEPIQRKLLELPPVELSEAHIRDGIAKLSVKEALQIRRRILTEGMKESSQSGKGAVRGKNVYKMVKGKPEISTHLPKLNKIVLETPFRLVEGVSLKEVAQASTPATPNASAQYAMEVPVSKQVNSLVRVSIEVVSQLPESTSRAHGEESGAAHFELTRQGGVGGIWEAKILLHEGIALEDVKHVVGHELNEVSLLVEKLHNATDENLAQQINVQAQAGIFQAGAKNGSLTVSLHDYAAAYEYFHLFQESVQTKSDLVVQKEIERIAAQNARSSTQQGAHSATQQNPQGSSQTSTSSATQPKAPSKSKWELVSLYDQQRFRMFRMLEAMGVAKRRGAHMEIDLLVDPASSVRLKTLLEMTETFLQKEKPGASQPAADLQRWTELQTQMRKQLRPLYAEALVPEINQGLPTDIHYTAENIEHILYPEHIRGRFVSDGIAGGHSDAELLAFQKQNPQFHFELHAQKTKTIGTLTAKEYAQYRYKDGSVPPPLGEEWNGPRFNRNDWVQAGQPKSTVNDVYALLHEGAKAFDLWKTTTNPPIPATGTNQKWVKVKSKNGFEFSGYANYDGIKKSWYLTTVYIEL